MIIRRYTTADRAGCHRVHFKAVRDGASEFYDPAQRAAWAPNATPDLEQPDRLNDQFCWVAENDGEIFGFMSVTNVGHIDMAFVLPEAMGTGLSTKLYKRVLQNAQARGLEALTVDASHLARRFFQKHGWRIEYQEDIDRSGVTLERFRMSLPLTEMVR